MVYSLRYGVARRAKTSLINASLSLVILTSGLSGAVPLFLSQPAAAATPDRYVSKTGTDSGDCSTSASACATINYAISQASTGNTIDVAAGTYSENVNINKADVTLEGAGATTTTIVATNGNANPLTFSSTGGNVSGFTITHDYTPAELTAWNFNNDTVLFAQSGHNNTLKDNTITLGRNGIYINTTENNSVIGNTITNNRTGINLTGDFTNTTITGNTISDNWTEGLVMYGTNNPGIDLSTVSVSGNTFDQNWYEQVLVKGPSHILNSTFTGTLDLNGNTFTDSPVTYTTSDSTTWDEPGFASLIPATLGGTATKPTTPLPTLRIYGTPAATMSYSPKTLRVGANEPYTTIQSAINDASDGDTVAVDNGSYAEALNITKNNLTISGQSQAGVVVTQSSATPYGQGVSIDGQSDVTIQNMTFTTPVGAPISYALQAYQSPGLTLSSLAFNGPGKTSSSHIGGVDASSSQNITYNNVSANNYYKNGFSFTAKYAATDTATKDVSLSNITASNDGYAGLAFYTVGNDKSTNVTPSTGGSANISGVTFGGSNTFSGDTKGIQVEGDSDANEAANNTPQWGITSSGNNPVDIGSSSFSGNNYDIVNYQTNNLEAMSATFSGKTGTNMSAAERTTEDGLIIDQVDYPSLGLVHYYTPDTTPPPVPALTSPADGATINKSAATLNWSDVTDAQGSNPVTYQYQSSYSSAVSGPNNSLSSVIYGPASTGTTSQIDATASGDATYYWQVRACDSVGNCSDWSGPWKVTIDSTTPNVPTNLSWKDSNNVVVADNGYTNQYSGTASWQESSTDVDHYIYKYWNNISTSSYNSEATAYTTTTSATSLPGVFNQGEGTHYFCVEAVDAAGNTSVCSATYAVTYDATAPVVHITAPAANSTVHGTVTVSGTVSDTNPDHYYFVVKDSHGGVVAGPGTIYQANVSNWNWNTKNVADGTYTVDLEARDKAGNKGSASTATEVVTVDNSVPGIPTGPEWLNHDGDVLGAFTNVNQVTPSWTAPANGTVDHYEYSYTSPTDSTWSNPEPFTATSIPDQSFGGSGNNGVEGPWQFRVRAVNQFGDTSGWATSSVLTYDKTPPVVTVDPLTTTDKTPTLTGTVSDTSLPVTVSILVDGNTYLATVTNGNWSANVTNKVGVGTYDVVATATDAAGNIGNDGTTGELTIQKKGSTDSLIVTNNVSNTTISNTNNVVASSFNLQGARTGGANSNGNTNGGNAQTGNAGNTANQQAVLGASTTNNSDGATGDTVNFANANTNKANSFVGLGWWWLAVLAVALGSFWWILGARRRNNNRSDA